jgi:hypothetical protein
VSTPTGIPLELIKPEALGSKVFEPLLLLGKQRWGFLDIRLRVKGGGHVSQVYGEPAGWGRVGGGGVEGWGGGWTGGDSWGWRKACMEFGVGWRLPNQARK